MCMKFLFFTSVLNCSVSNSYSGKHSSGVIPKFNVLDISICSILSTVSYSIQDLQQVLLPLLLLTILLNHHSISTWREGES